MVIHTWSSEIRTTRVPFKPWEYMKSQRAGEMENIKFEEDPYVNKLLSFPIDFERADGRKNRRIQKDFYSNSIKSN